ncbi:MAG: glycoside hydrolase family 3 N-terminal domain-containing protein [bacterium]
MRRGSFFTTMVIVVSLQWTSPAAGVQSPEGDKGIYNDGWNDLNKNGEMDPYENPELDIELRIDDLLARMTLEEKTCQMATLYGFCRVAKDELPTEQWSNEIWKDGIANIDEHLNGLDRPHCKTEYSWPPSKHAWALNEVQRFFVEKTRLGIPVDFTIEGIRGVCHERATSFPAQIGVGSAWDKELVAAIGHVTGKEARALGYTNIYSPILDLARDPRWGRTVESYSEDPYLASQLGMMQVKALQAEGVVSTPKHFAVYSIPKGGRDGAARTDPKVPLRDVETIYLAPFRAAIRDAGALGVMSSYNDYNGVPVSGSREFLTEVLRQKWHFKGYIVSDSDAIKFIFSKHHVAPTYKDAVRQAVEAGLNVRTTFTPPEVFINPLRELVNEGKLAMKTIDERVRCVLRVKFLLGLFDHPFVEHPELSDKIVRSKEHQALSLQAARESIVLLKNEDDLLPLRKDIKSILIAGPNAKATKELMSRYGPSKVDVITVVEGIKNKVSSRTEVKYAKGCELIDAAWPESEILPNPPTESEKKQIEEARQLAAQVEVAIVVLGESRRTVGESHSRTSLDLTGYQLNLVKAIYETGTPTVVVLMNGRPLSINWIDRYIPAIVEAWFPGEFGGQAIADVLFGDYNPGGKLPITFPKTVGQIPMNFPYKPGSQAGVNSNNQLSRILGVLYPFGHGLSYTEFKYSHLEITPKQQGPAGNVVVRLDVENVGHRKGEEVVQLYVNDVVSSVTTFVKALRGFERITLAPGEKKTVTFTLTPDDLSLLNLSMEWVVEPGMFEVMVGSSSEDIRLQDNLEILE